MYNVGDKVVYPMHGAGIVDSIEEKEVLGEKQSYYILKMPGEVKVMVPTQTAEQHGIRNIIDKTERVIHSRYLFKTLYTVTCHGVTTFYLLTAYPLAEQVVGFLLVGTHV